MTANRLGAQAQMGPTLWSQGDDQFGVHVDSASNIIVSHFDRATRTLLGTFDLSTIPGNPLSLPLDADDNHEAPSICVTANGIIHVAGNNFNDDGQIRIVKSSSPLDITAWTNETSSFSPLGGHIYAYVFFAPFSDGAVMAVYRDRTFSGIGTERVAVMPVGSSTWTHRTPVIAGNPGESTGENAFYRNNHYIDVNDRVHLFGVWDDASLTTEVSNHSYCYSDDRGVTWRNIAGTLLTTPFSRGSASGIAARTGVSFGPETDDMLWASGCAVDADGYPCAILDDRHSDPGPGQTIIRWNGSAWTTNTQSYRYGGGASCNLVNYRGDLWTLGRPSGGTLTELRRVASPNEVINIGGIVGTGWYTHYDPIALNQHGFIEVLIADPSPKVFTFGDNHRLSKGSSIPADAILTEDGLPILTEDGQYILIE